MAIIDITIPKRLTPAFVFRAMSPELPLEVLAHPYDTSTLLGKAFEYLSNLASVTGVRASQSTLKRLAMGTIIPNVLKEEEPALDKMISIVAESFTEIPGTAFDDEDLTKADISKRKRHATQLSKLIPKISERGGDLALAVALGIFIFNDPEIQEVTTLAWGLLPYPEIPYDPSFEDVMDFDKFKGVIEAIDVALTRCLKKKKSWDKAFTEFCDDSDYVELGD